MNFRIHRSLLMSMLLMVVLLVTLPMMAMAQTDVTGQTDTGAYYRFMVPDGWEPADGLVIWNHGFDLSPIGPVEDLGPLALVQLSEGYAVAASSYSLSGWAVFQTLEDNRQMVRIFEETFGVPEQVFLNGASLGGLVTIQGVEQGGLGNVVGAYPICGVLAGSRAWDGGFDLRQLYDLVCDDVPGGAIPGGATGLPSYPDPDFDQNAVAQAVNVCTGVLLPADQRTPEQAARLAQLTEVSQLPEEFILTDMIFATLGLSDLIFDPNKLGGGQALGNTHVDYGDADVNASVPRIALDPAARTRLYQNYTPNGNIGETKIVSIHTDKDGLVTVENESDYAAKVPASQFSLGVVVEDTPSHCGFTVAEAVAGWEALRAWVAGANQPNAAVLQATCEAVEAQGAPGPCRIDPTFEVPDFTDRVRERDICETGPTTLCLNDDRFRVEVNWRDFEGNEGPGRTVDAGTPDSGLLWFFSPDNWEVLVKVLDGCSINNHFWVFAAATTNVEYEMTVTDTTTGASASYSNPLGVSSPAITDNRAFATCP